MKEGSLMVTAVEYPEGCFWQRDSSGGTGECHISLYCNGSRTVSVPSGAGFPASHDPDMHRCIDGKLYTDYSDGGRTYVCENGNLLFSYEGREMLCGFLIKDGDIYTLGQNRGGEGLSFRKNGTMVFSSGTGSVIGSAASSSSRTGALYEDDGSIVFCFRSTSISQGNALTSCYIVRDGKSEKLSFPETVSSVYDIRQIGGKVVAAVKHVTPAKSPALIMEGEMKSLPLSISNIDIGSCLLRWDGSGNIALSTAFSGDGWKTIRRAIVRNNGSKVLFSDGETITDFWICGDDYAYPIVREGVLTLFYTDGWVRKSINPEGRYSLMSPACMTFDGNSVTAGLSPKDSAGFPLIIRGSRMEELQVNGYVTSVGYSGSD